MLADQVAAWKQHLAYPNPDAPDLSDEEVARLCRGLVDLGLERYVRQWWSPSDERAHALQARLHALRPAIKRAIERQNAYRQARAENAAAKRQARAVAHERAETLRETLGTTALPATNEQPDTYYPDDAPLSFAWTDDTSQIGVFWNGTRVGTLDPFGAHRLDAQALLDLPWTAMVGRFDAVTQGRDTLRFTIDWPATASALAERKRNALSPPRPPDGDNATPHQ